MFTGNYDSIITLENLLLVWQRFLQGKRHRKDVAQFQTLLAQNLLDLYTELKNKTYVHGSYSVFNISDPKPRVIHKASVRDRVVHHLLYKELYWYFHPRFVWDSYSCRVGKGTHRALNRFAAFARKVSANHTKTCYVLKCDIKKFFASINHTVLIKIIERHIADPHIRWLISQVIRSFDAGVPGVGLPLGNLTSQLLVNVYMHEFDMYLKQELRVKYYLRYADDFVILADQKDYLETTLMELDKFLREKLRLNLHEHKVSIKTYASGVDFLGWVHFPYHRQLRAVARRKMTRAISGYPKPETLNSYRGLLSHGNTYKIRKMLGLVDYG